MTNLQAAFLENMGVQVGDMVKIIRDVPKGEHGSTVEQNGYSRRRVGGTFRVDRISTDRDAVRCDGYWFTATAIEKIPGIQLTLADGHRITKDGDTFTEKESGETFTISRQNLLKLQSTFHAINDQTGYMSKLSIGCVEITFEDLALLLD